MEAEAWFFSLLFLPEVSCKNNWSPISVVSVQIAVFDFSSEARTYCSITSGNVCECLTALNHRFRSTNDALDWFNVYVFFLSFFLPFLSLSLSFISFVLSLSLFFFSNESQTGHVPWMFSFILITRRTISLEKLGKKILEFWWKQILFRVKWKRCRPTESDGA